MEQQQRFFFKTNNVFPLVSMRRGITTHDKETERVANPHSCFLIKDPPPLQSSILLLPGGGTEQLFLPLPSILGEHANAVKPHRILDTSHL